MADDSSSIASHRALLQVFVELADTLVADYDVVDFLHGLAVRCVELLDVSDAGVMLLNRAERLQYVASSSERMRVVELLELQVGEGPCFDAVQSHERQSSQSAEEAIRRWPSFGPRARDAGFASMTGVPLRLRAEVIGVLNLFSERPGGIGTDVQRVAQALADVATIGVLQERAIHDGNVVTGQLEHALHSRVLIEQAKGILAERRAVSVDDSFGILRDTARAGRRKLTDVARDVIGGTLLSEQRDRLGRGSDGA